MLNEKRLKSFYKSFAYYDRTGMQKYLEEKASEGWRLVKRPFAREWEFERTDPQKLHYAISYLPQFSNEDSFLLSDKKKEYIDLCAASGWHFVCAYKNMVIFSNYSEDPIPLQTDPEVEIDTIHKSFLRHSLPVIIFAFILFMLMFFKTYFSDPSSKGYDLSLAFYAVLSAYSIAELFGYLRWRKKALAAAAAGDFLGTDIPDKLLPNLLGGFVIICSAIVIIKSIILGKWETLLLMAIIAVSVILSIMLFIFTDKLKDKTDAVWKKRIISIVSYVFYFSVLFCVKYICELF